MISQIEGSEKIKKLLFLIKKFDPQIDHLEEKLRVESELRHKIEKHLLSVQLELFKANNQLTRYTRSTDF